MKRAGLISALCLLLGVAVFLCGFAMMGFDPRNFDTDPVYTEKIAAFGGELSVTLSDEGASVRIGRSDDGKIRVKYYENVNKTYDIEEKDGKLTIKKRIAAGFLDRMLNISVSAPVFSIYLPEGYSGRLKIKSDQAITAGDFSAKSISLDSGDGVNISAVRAGENLTVSANGRIDAYDISCGGDCRLTGSRGVFAQTVRAADFYSMGKTDALTLVDVTADTVFAESAGAGLRLETVAFSKSANFIADRGDISGSVVGEAADFTFNCEAKGGSCNIDDDLGNGPRQLNASTAAGDINIILVPARN